MTLQFSAHDPDGDALTFGVAGLPSDLSMDPSNGLISGTIGSTARTEGPYVVTVTADDGKGGTTTVSFVVNID